MSIAATGPIKRVACIDDDHDEIIITQSQLRRLGLDVVEIPGPITSADDLVSLIMKEADACICDNYLQPKNFAQFYGAEPVAKLNQEGFPALLVTQYFMDQDVSMRQWRRHTPVVLAKEDMDPDRIAQGFHLCLQEIAGVVAPHRMPARTILEIKRIGDEDCEEVVDVLIPSWKPHHAVRFPIALIPHHLRPIRIGQRLIAEVNTGALSESELFFDEFELAPDLLQETYFG